MALVKAAIPEVTTLRNTSKIRLGPGTSVEGSKAESNGSLPLTAFTSTAGNAVFASHDC
jgi:hypothetical protein